MIAQRGADHSQRAGVHLPPRNSEYQQEVMRGGHRRGPAAEFGCGPHAADGVWGVLLPGRALLRRAERRAVCMTDTGTKSYLRLFLLRRPPIPQSALLFRRPFWSNSTQITTLRKPCTRQRGRRRYHITMREWERVRMPATETHSRRLHISSHWRRRNQKIILRGRLTSPQHCTTLSCNTVDVIKRIEGRLVQFAVHLTHLEPESASCGTICDLLNRDGISNRRLGSQDRFAIANATGDFERISSSRAVALSQSSPEALDAAA